MKDLKARAIRGGFAKVCAQGANFVLRIGSLMVLARLLDPKDFGLVGMVTAVTGVLSLFKDFGLSTASVQRSSVTEEQVSTLFWINLLVGVALCSLTILAAPFIVRFYHEPALFWVTIVLALGFLFNAAGVQHGAILQRDMRFTTLSLIDIVSLILSTSIGIGMAIRGYGYWALVGMTLCGPLVSTIYVILVTRWVPGKPRRGVGIGSLMRFGGTITLNGLVVYFAYNLEKVLLGRFWGASVVGIYGRAYQLSNIPTENLNSSIGGVAFSALSRVQHDPVRLRSYFLKCYSLVLALSVPLTILGALFAVDAISVLLGPKWREAAPIFRLLTPTILTFAMINPFAWLLFSMGKVRRSLHIALVITPLVIAGYLIGLPYGPKGVALGYSVAMGLWILPHILWCVHGTSISVRDVFQTLIKPLLSSLVAALLPFALQVFCGNLLSPLLRVAIGVTIFLFIYCGMLLYVMGQKSFYLDLLRGLRSGTAVDSDAIAVAQPG